jgi:hypothetical protein
MHDAAGELGGLGLDDCQPKLDKHGLIELGQRHFGQRRQKVIIGDPSVITHCGPLETLALATVQPRSNGIVKRLL